MAYARFFMPLHCEARGYEFKGKTPAGRVVLEEHNGVGKLKLWVQDLKCEAIYHVYMVFSHNRRHVGFDMGALRLDTRGKSELIREVLPSDINGYSFGEIVTVAIVAKSSAQAQVVSPLCGYRNAVMQWRHDFDTWESMMAQKKEILPENAAKSNMTEENHTFGDKADDVPIVVRDADTPLVVGSSLEGSAPLDGGISQDDAQDASSPLVVGNSLEGSAPPEEYISQDDAQGASPLLVAGNSLEGSAPLEEDISQDDAQATTSLHQNSSTHVVTPLEHDWLKRHTTSKRTHDITQDSTKAPGYIHARKSTMQLLEAIAQESTPIQPFTTQERNIKWVKSRQQSQIPFPIECPHIMSETFMINAWANHEHFILGITTDGEPMQYIIGIAGTYTPEDEKRAHILGFSQFKYCDSTHVKPDVCGYWLMFVDF